MARKAKPKRVAARPGWLVSIDPEGNTQDLVCQTVRNPFTPYEWMCYGDHDEAANDSYQLVVIVAKDFDPATLSTFPAVLGVKEVWYLPGEELAGKTPERGKRFDHPEADEPTWVWFDESSAQVDLS